MNNTTRQTINAIIAARARLTAALAARHAATQRTAVRSLTLSGNICH